MLEKSPLISRFEGETKSLMESVYEPRVEIFAPKYFCMIIFPTDVAKVYICVTGSKPRVSRSVQVNGSPKTVCSKVGF